MRLRHLALIFVLSAPSLLGPSAALAQGSPPGAQVKHGEYLITTGLCHDCHISDKEDRAEARMAELRKRLGKAELPNLYRAFHTLCRNCHIAENAQKKTKAPVDCGGCHKTGATGGS